MTRKLIAALILVLAGGLFLQPGYCFGQGKTGKKKGRRKVPPYVHTVIFYLKKDAPKGTTAAVIRDSHKMLAKIPTVRRLWVGRPAKQATDIAKKDYQVGLTILFDDYEGLKTYLKHPIHLRFVDMYLSRFESVAVYDFANQKK